MTYDQIIADLKRKVYHPIYFLMGEESYYIDAITDYIARHVLEDHEKEFNQTVLYGRDTNVDAIVEHAKRFPMMANHQVVIIKEAQHLKKLDALLPYVENPQNTTILVFNYKYKSLDKRKTIAKTLKKKAVLFESKKLYDNKIPDWIMGYMRGKNYNITPKTAMILTEFLGNDLSKIANELEKLMVSLPENSDITPVEVEKNIGISKDFNNFELQNAIGKKDVYKANQIITHFSKNPKDHPLIVTVISLFTFFSNILLFHVSKDKSPKGIASLLKIHPFFVKDYQVAAKNFSARKAVDAISLLKEYDLKLKGVNNAGTPDGELLKELTYKLLH